LTSDFVLSNLLLAGLPTWYTVCIAFTLRHIFCLTGVTCCTGTGEISQRLVNHSPLFPLQLGCFHTPGKKL